MEYRLPDYKKIDSVHIVFDSDLDRDTLPGHRCEKTHVTRANVLLDSPQMHPPKTLCKAFELTANTSNGEAVLLSVSNNIKRAYHVKVPHTMEISSLKLKMIANWGDSNETNLISFDFND